MENNLYLCEVLLPVHTLARRITNHQKRHLMNRHLAHIGKNDISTAACERR